MTDMSSPRPRNAIGIRRREMLQIGYSGLLGLSLPGIFARRAESRPPAAAQPRAKTVILVFLTGAPSHHDTFDMKPDAPAEIRGEFKPIATSTPGLHVCEHLPLLAARSKHYAIVRSLSHAENNHLIATHHMLTGHQQPGAFFDKVASRDDFPCYASACDYLRPRRDAIPSGVNLPTHLFHSPLTWPGQHAGLLGPKYDPWQIKGDPSAADFRVNDLALAPGIDVERFKGRQALLDQVNAQQRRLAAVGESRSMLEQQQLAFSLLTSNKLGQAFELNRETDATRDHYGRTMLGQSLLIARRLAEIGVPMVQVNAGYVQAWDSHGDIFPTLKDKLLPPLDQGLAALFDDLSDRRMLDDTFVMMVGEFGRTPKISISQNGIGAPGRDHWAPCFFGLFAGAGVRGGQVIGKSDSIGAYPLTKPYSPSDVGATVYHMLGLDPASEARDRFDRPLRLNHGSVMHALFSGG